MLRELERIIESSENEFDVNDLTGAAAKLREKQFIFRESRGQGRTYDILINQSDYFERLFAAFDDEFFIDRYHGYCGILPSTSRPALKKIETIFLLILAKLHDLECRKARSENGKTHPSEAILIDEYCQITGKEKPKLVETRATLYRLAKAGVIEIGPVNEMTEMPTIIILPSIMRVVSSSYLSQLEAFVSSNETLDGDTSDEDEDDIDQIPNEQDPNVGDDLKEHLGMDNQSVFNKSNQDEDVG